MCGVKCFHETKRNLKRGSASDVPLLAERRHVSALLARKSRAQARWRGSRMPRRASGIRNGVEKRRRAGRVYAWPKPRARLRAHHRLMRRASARRSKTRRAPLLAGGARGATPEILLAPRLLIRRPGVKIRRETRAATARPRQASWHRAHQGAAPDACESPRRFANNGTAASISERAWHQVAACAVVK